MGAVQRTLVVSTACVLAAIPPLLVASAIARFAVDVPIQDQWPFASEVVAWHEGRYTLRRLWFPNGQHRVPLPKLVMLPLAAQTGWDVRAEMWLNFAFSLLALALLAALARRTLRPVVGAGWTCLLPLLAIALFSLVAWQSWTWGWMMAAYLNVLGVALVAWALGRFGARPAGVALVTLGAVAAALSFLTGFVLFALAPLALLLLGRDGAIPRRGAALGAACVVFAVVAGVYAATYPAMMRRMGPPLAFDPLGVARFVVLYLGSPLAGRNQPAALLWGTSGLVLLAVSTALVWLRAPELRRAFLPWLLVATYTIGAGAMTAVGRMGGSMGHALLSRYTTVSGLFWASLPACVVLAAAAAGLFTAPRRVRAGAAVAAAVALALLLDSYTVVRQVGLGQLAHRREVALAARACLLASRRAPDVCLTPVNRDTRLVRQLSTKLAALHLGPFRERPGG